MPPATYEEDPAAQAARGGYVYAYPPYGYPGQVCSLLLWWCSQRVLMSEDADGSADDAWDGPSSPGLSSWSVHAAYALPYAPSKWCVM